MEQPFRPTHQVFNGMIKQENIDDESFNNQIVKEELVYETWHHNDYQLIQKRSICENEEIKIKVEKDLIDCFAFEGAVLSESHSLELTMHNMESNLREMPLRHNVCNNAFSNLSKVAVDKKFQNGNNHHKCTICDKSFNSNAKLTKHVKFHTRKESEEPKKILICAICDKSYKKSYFKIHTMFHTGQKPHKCTICDKGFTFPSDLRKHTRTHTGEKPYKCDNCDKRFSTRSNLKSHTRTYTCVKLYTCDICDQNFSLKGDLKSHITTHTCVHLYECYICNQIFKKIKNLKSHVMALHF